MSKRQTFVDFGKIVVGTTLALTGCSDDTRSESQTKLAEHVIIACESAEEFNNPVTGFSHFILKYNKDNEYVTAGHLVDSQSHSTPQVAYIYEVEKSQKNNTEISFGLNNSRKEYFSFRLNRQSMLLNVMTPNFGMSYLNYKCNQLGEKDFQDFLKEKQAELDELHDQRKI